MSVVAIVVAAGRGTRAGDGPPKQYRSLAGRPVLARSLEIFLSHPEVTRVQPVIGAEDAAAYDAVLAALPHTGDKLLRPANGGATRQRSVLAGLEAAADGEVALVHDAARPFASAALIGRAVAAARAHGAAVPGVGVTDTIKLVGADQRHVVETPPRERLRAVQTPQAFAYPLLLDAHRRAREAGLDGFTDDAAIAEWAGTPVAVFEGDAQNVKLTHPADFDAAERRLGGDPGLMVPRTGTGFDVHAFADAGDHVWLGGVRIPHERGVLAHSDGDVVLHALTDALLGAIADGDIGVHFPPSDPRWRGAASDRFLADAAERVRARGGVIDHLDVTVLCEAPKVGPHREAMRARIAAVAGVPLGAVSIKATTTERLGFTGRREGLAAQAAASVRLPSEVPPA